MLTYLFEKFYTFEGEECYAKKLKMNVLEDDYINYYIAFEAAGFPL